MTTNGKIPATIITGFLGAGKTSLVQSLIRRAGGTRLAFIINEFGALGMDGEIVKGCGLADCPEENIVELANGCICCTVADDFLPSLSYLLDRPNPPEHIVIETSGLALPKPLIKAFAWPEVRARSTVDGVIAVIDGPALAAGRFAEDEAALARQRAADNALDHDNPIAELFEDQLGAADLIILNKADLLTPEARDRARAILAERMKRPLPILEASFGALDPALLLGLGLKAEDDLANRPSHHEAEGEDHEHDEFESFALAFPILADPEDLARRLAKAASRHGILRAKGFLAIAGKEMRLVLQGVGERIQIYYDRAWRPEEIRQGRLVVIGLKGLAREAIAADLGAGIA